MPRSQLTTIVLLILLVAMVRLLPHPMNITPVGALGLFAGAMLPARIMWLLPVGALLLGDSLIGFYSLPILLMVYLGFAGSAWIGRALLAHRRTPFRLGAAVLASASLFFLLSNFGAWLVLYPLTLAGMAECYVNALPFFGNSLIGDAFYTLLMFGSYEWISRHQDSWRYA
ncbi:DUF6580 family putative transport protein [Nitrosomonas halophila]|uniref:Rod shape-determining protein MreD n=1 Tax=Nitrosomonas halophila TaxID=44576 RepID=A0A1H3H7K0_9PROT|nr:DUF6580 family putative transport protein [Nitrosomonas halophila]SDY10629.1 hypothetical protein SAMN05421881_101827 [Nitrosomonas halophila]